MNNKFQAIMIITYITALGFVISGCSRKTTKKPDKDYDQRLTEYIKGSSISKVVEDNGYVWITTDNPNKRICIKGTLINSHE